METEVMEMEVDKKALAGNSKKEFCERQSKRRPRAWLFDSERMPKVRRVLSINPESDRDSKAIFSVLFVPTDVCRDPVKLEFKLERKNEHRTILNKLSSKFNIPPSEIVLRYVDGDIFKQLPGQSISELESSNIVAYQAPHLRSRVKKIQRFLKTLPDTIIRDFDVLNSTIYHRPFRVLKKLECLKGPADSVRSKNVKQWLCRIFKINLDSNSSFPGSFLMHLQRLKTFVRETCSMEQYTILVVAAQDINGWRHLTIPQYVPYTAGEITYRQLRGKIVQYVRRCLQGQHLESMKLLHTGSRCPMKGQLTDGAKTHTFPDDEDALVLTRLSMIICDVVTS
eukprot:CAMPEP_0197529814 /NCGR_PEP_ID=MMETSP1318-20131121/29776_1 /TAXON_ID=552666 /ORGANISM="Partenskyella glossopodia, Strain RCC365" /LENGTH=338 /DNA_ID=CAMNT_0043085421 /DNA_START=274 /DNA_END=1290 /DNA_ORIENTATION=+